MPRRSRAHVAFASLLSLAALNGARSADAQAPSATRPATARTPTPRALPAAASTPTNAPTPPPASAAQLPAPPTVNDPMLAPVPPAADNVASWEDVLSMIRARSTDLKIALGEVIRAEGQWRVALAGALPSLTGLARLNKDLLTKTTTGIDPLSGQTVTTTSPTSDVTLSGSLTLVQPLFAPRAWYGIKTADLNEDVARLSLEETKRQIAIRVSGAVIAVVTAERVAELNRIGLRASLERLDLTTRKQALGAATGLDVLRAQQDVAASRATLVSGDESLRQSRESLGLALGVAGPVGVASDINLDGLEKTTGSVCRPASSADERTDVATARGRVTLAEREVGDVKWQFSPTINAQSTLASTTANTFAAPATTWNIQGVLSWNIWEGGARYGALRQAHVDVERAENTLVATKRGVEVELSQTRRAIDVAESSRKVAADARTLAAEADRLTRAGYLEGQGTSLELVLAAQALRQAEVTLALREFDLVRARIQAILSGSNCPF